MKLPDLQFASVGAARLTGPAEAVAESSQRLNLVNQAQAGASDIATARGEYQTKKSYAEYADHMASFRKEAAKEFAVGKEKIIAWGLDDEIDVDSKDVFYRDEWYPLALQRVQDKAREEYGQKISSPMARAAFDMDIGNTNSEILARETEQAQREAMQEHQAMVRADIDTYMARGNWDSAVMAVNAATDLRPSEKQAMLLTITAGRDENTIRDEVQALTEKQSAAGLSEYAKYLRSDEASEVFSVGPEALDQWAARADTTAKGIVDGAEISATKANKAINAANINAVETMMRNGQSLDVNTINKLSADAAARGDDTAVKYWAKTWDNYVSQGGNSVHAPKGQGDRQLYEALSLMDRDELEIVDLNEVAPQLDEKQYTTLFDRQVSFRNAKEAAPTTTAANVYSSNLNLALGNTGLLAISDAAADIEESSVKKSQKAQLTAAYNDAVTTLEAQLKRGLTAEEARGVADTVALPFIQAEYETNSSLFGVSYSTEEAGTIADQIIATSSKASEADKPVILGRLIGITKELGMEFSGPVTRDKILQRYKEYYP